MDLYHNIKINLKFDINFLVLNKKILEINIKN
jgi:hypothetical protein